jgi:hypothetical protein
MSCIHVIRDHKSQVFFCAKGLIVVFKRLDILIPEIEFDFDKSLISSILILLISSTTSIFVDCELGTDPINLFARNRSYTLRVRHRSYFLSCHDKLRQEYYMRIPVPNMTDCDRNNYPVAGMSATI